MGAHDPLSAGLNDLRALCRETIAAGKSFGPRELAGIGELLTRMEAEALRLESFETEARAFRIAEAAMAFLRNHPVVDLAVLEAAMVSEKVVIFPGRRAAERRP